MKTNKMLKKIAIATNAGHCPWHWDEVNRAGFPAHWSDQRITAHFASLAIRDDKRKTRAKACTPPSMREKGEIVSLLREKGFSKSFRMSRREIHFIHSMYGVEYARKCIPCIG
jgi:hypothetical protein